VRALAQMKETRVVESGGPQCSIAVEIAARRRYPGRSRLDEHEVDLHECLPSSHPLAGGNTRTFMKSQPLSYDVRKKARISISWTILSLAPQVTYGETVNQ
jgi:hypothetical protein